jgi:hypothetical protein
MSKFLISGTVARLTAAEDSGGGFVLTFDIVPEGGGAAVPCIIPAYKVVSGFADRFPDGSAIKVFGHYEKQDVRAPGGEPIRRKLYNVLWIFPPASSTKAA